MWLFSLNKAGLPNKQPQPMFFRNGNDVSKLTGTIVSIDENGQAVVLIDNRLLHIHVPWRKIQTSMIK